MSAWDEFFDPDGDNPLQLTKDESEAFKQAILDMNYDELFRPLYARLEELKKRNGRAFLAIIIVQLIILVLQVLK